MAAELPMLVFLRAVQEHGVGTREALIEAGHHPKVIDAKAVKASAKGYTEFGVVADRPWLTDKGRLFLTEREHVGDHVVLYRNEDGTIDVLAHPPVVVISREYVEDPPSYCEVDGNGFFIHAANGTFRYRLFDLDPLTDRYTARYMGTAEEGDLADLGWDRYKEGF